MHSLTANLVSVGSLRPDAPFRARTPSFKATSQWADCLICGYALHARDAAGPCPECGFAAAPSIRRTYMDLLTPGHRHAVQGGFQLLSITNWIGLAALLAATIAVGAAFVIGAQPHASYLIVLAAPPLLTIAGLWRISTPDPDIARFDRLEPARSMLRATLFVNAILILAVVALLAHPSILDWSPQWADSLPMRIPSAGLLTAIVLCTGAYILRTSLVSVLAARLSGRTGRTAAIRGSRLTAAVLAAPFVALAPAIALASWSDELVALELHHDLAVALVQMLMPGLIVADAIVWISWLGDTPKTA